MQRISTEKPTITITGLALEQELIDVSGSEVDPEWRFVNAAGNEHRWEKDADGIWALPTLEERVSSIPCWDEFREASETREFAEYYAPATGERVYPGMRYFTRHIPGLASATVTFRSDAIPPEGRIRLGDCIFPKEFARVTIDIGDWSFLVTEWRKAGPEHYCGAGTCIGAPPKAKEVVG